MQLLREIPIQLSYKMLAVRRPGTTSLTFFTDFNPWKSNNLPFEGRESLPNKTIQYYFAGTLHWLYGTLLNISKHLILILLDTTVLWNIKSLKH